jgi:hypothetical protein
MKQLFALVFVCFVMAAQGQQNPYFKIFQPNRNSSGEALKNSPQKAVIVMSCDLETTSRQDSAGCLENVSKYDEKGRITEEHELYLGLLRKYTYDDKNRVTNYTETQINTNTQELNLSITYDKKGRITQLVNKATQGAKSVVFYENDQRLLVSETMGAIDELFFNNGRIVKYINKNSSEIVLFAANYEYNKDGQLIKETGIDIIEGAGSRFLITTLYNAKGKIETETAEYWEEATPANKQVKKTTYFYNDNGQLYQKEKNSPGQEELITVYMYDGQNRITSVNYSQGSTRLVTLYYYYR